MNNLFQISESLETVSWVEILKFFDADPGSWMEKIRIQDPGWKKFGSGSATLSLWQVVPEAEVRELRRGARPFPVHHPD
jgi:hypothetical protein